MSECAAAASEEPQPADQQLSDLLALGPVGDSTADYLSLFDLFSCALVSVSIRAWATDAVVHRKAVTKSDVEAGVHARALHWLVGRSSQPHITLAAGTYVLGDMDVPGHVHAVRPPAPDDEDSEEFEDWLNWAPEWREGFGPLHIARPLTLVGGQDATLTATMNMGWAVEVDGEPRSVADGTYPNGMPKVRPSGYTTVPVRLEGLNLSTSCGTGCLYINPCSCQSCGQGCSCTPYGGPHVTAHDCTFDSAAWMFVEGKLTLSGDSVFDDRQVEPGGTKLVTKTVSVKCFVGRMSGWPSAQPPWHEPEAWRLPMFSHTCITTCIGSGGDRLAAS